MSYKTYFGLERMRMYEIVLYFFYTGKKAVLTNGLLKKTKKTPGAAIELAKKYKADYEGRKRREQL